MNKPLHFYTEIDGLQQLKNIQLSVLNFVADQHKKGNTILRFSIFRKSSYCFISFGANTQFSDANGFMIPDSRFGDPTFVNSRPINYLNSNSFDEVIKCNLSDFSVITTASAVQDEPYSIWLELLKNHLNKYSSALISIVSRSELEHSKFLTIKYIDCLKSVEIAPDTIIQLPPAGFAPHGSFSSFDPAVQVAQARENTETDYLWNITEKKSKKLGSEWRFDHLSSGGDPADV